MSVEGAHENEMARFDTSECSPEVEAALRNLANELIRENQVTTKVVSNFFFLKPGTFTRAHIDYFEAYVKVVVPQLVIGAYLGPNFDVRTLPPEEQVAAIKERKSRLLFDGGTLFWHDVAHSMIAVARSPDKSNVLSSIPMFQIHTQDSKDYASEDERRHSIGTMMNDEGLAVLWGLTSQNSVQSAIRESKSLDEFMGRLYYYQSEKTDEAGVRILKMMYDNYDRGSDKFKSETILYDIFVKETDEYMRVHASKARRVFQKSQQRHLK